MKGDGVNEIIMCIIVLKESVRPVVEDFNLLIRAARSNAGTIWMKLYIWNHPCVIGERVNLGVWVDVPQSHSFIVTGRGNHPSIEGELSFSDPVRVTFEGLHKLPLDDRPHFDGFIVWCWEQIRSITVELDTFYWSGMTLQDVWESFSIIVPESNCVIFRCRS